MVVFSCYPLIFGNVLSLTSLQVLFPIYTLFIYFISRRYFIYLFLCFCALASRFYVTDSTKNKTNKKTSHKTLSLPLFIIFLFFPWDCDLYMAIVLTQQKCAFCAQISNYRLSRLGISLKKHIFCWIEISFRMFFCLTFGVYSLCHFYYKPLN
jgi:hypothetical protein